MDHGEEGGPKQMSNRSKACAISAKVRKKAYIRDNGECIFCGASYPHMQIAHYIPRSQGGLGIIENVGVTCIYCHTKLDSGTNRKPMMKTFKLHLLKKHPNFKDKDRVYKNRWIA